MRTNRSRRKRSAGTAKKSTLFPSFFSRSSVPGPATRESNCLSFERLEPRLALAVVISEFLADNANGITDFADERHDWIELQNTGGSAVNVAGWYLTDDAANLTKWQIPSDPSTLLDPGEYLTIFASEKNGVYSGELHTNFKLTTLDPDSGLGEYLGLVMSNGTTVAYDFGAAYPEQFADVSYGIGITTSSTSSETLVADSSPLTVISPKYDDELETGEDADRDDHWREIGYDDSEWLSGTGSVGFDRQTPPVAPDLTPYIGRVLTTTEMNSLADADNLDEHNQYSAYIRYEFDVTNKDQLTSLELALRFDDGFIAYLNDREVWRVNFGEDFVHTQPAWDSYAGNQTTSSTAGAANRVDEADDLVTVDLSAYLPWLVEGTNVLAFHGVNSNSTSGTPDTNRLDFLIDPELTAERATGSSQVGYMVAPSPDRGNGVSTLGIVADTEFSHHRGFYDAAFDLTITTATSGATIRYTTDGSIPTPASTAYAGPITLDTTTILRAVAFKDGYTPTNVDTQTYIFLADVILQDDSYAPPTSGTWGHDKAADGDTTTGYNLDPDDADWEMDSDIVGGVETTEAVINALTSIPTMSVVMDWDDLFGGNPLPGTFPAGSTVAVDPQGIYIMGRSSERYTSLEFIDPDVPTDQFQVDASIEIQGHSSPTRWNSDKLSFQVKFKFPYGDTELNYPLFLGSPDGESATTQFDQLILDAMFNYTWIHQNITVQTNFARFVTDQVVSDLQNLASGGGPHGKYVHLYLNGLYWGVYNVHERPDDSFAAEYDGGDKDDYYVVKHANNDIDHEYTWVEGGIAAEQDYQALLNAAGAVETNPSSLATYQAVEDILDIDSFIDYMIVHYYAGNAADWAHNNWYATRNHVEPGGKWRFHAWDQEHAFPTTDNGDDYDQFENLTGKDDLEAPTEIQRNLINNEEYRLRFADRVQELMYNGGVLTESAAQAAYEARTNEIDQAIIGESARWGDNREEKAEYAGPYTRADFITIKNGVLSNFFPVRTSTVLGHFDGAGWIPSLDAPLFNQYGGEIESGFDLVITKPGGSPGGATIYYTLDGSDPRVVGGGISASAIAYSGPIDLTEATQVNARIYYNTTGTANDWSPVVDKMFTIQGQSPDSLRIVELMYNPAGSDELEYIELLNTGAGSISLDGVKIDFDASQYALASGQTLAAGERLVVPRYRSLFEAAYPSVTNLATGDGYADVVDHNLDNGHETITLLGPGDAILQLFTYDDASPWPTLPDNGGPSLVYNGPFPGDEDPLDGSPDDPFDDAANWQASSANGGSPGEAEPSANHVPVITSNGGGATADVYVAENTTAVTTVTATDDDVPPDTLTFSLTGGADSGQFNIGGSSGVLTFITAKDYEVPSDANFDGVYVVEVTVDDGNSGTDSQVISVTVTNVNEPPVITNNGGGATASVNAQENQTAVTTVTSTDVDGGAPVYSIIGGADQALFGIGGASGVLTFVIAPDYENPTDANTDGVYEVTVQVSDGNGGTDSQAISVTVTNVNEPPVITSNGGGATASVNAQENQTAVTTVTSTDVDGGTPVYSIIGGADQAQFGIGGASGVLTFNTAPDFENPTDANTDGVYEVTVQVSDGNGGTDSQVISVTVTDESEPGLPGDYDGSGTIDNDDYLQWKSDFGTTVDPAGSGSDGNGNGVVDAADYTVWRDIYEATLGAGSGSALASAAVIAPVEAASSPAANVSVPIAVKVQDDAADADAPAQQEPLLAMAEPIEQTVLRRRSRDSQRDRLHAADTSLRTSLRLREQDLLLQRDHARQSVDMAFETSSPWVRRLDDGEVFDAASSDDGLQDSIRRDSVWRDDAWVRSLSHRRVG